jgi:RNA polymerase-interacting CarD/CdnL/TRCF family regulator
MDTASSYSIGDWIVHKYYGVGQIKKTEPRQIHGESIKCFRVKTKDSTFWFPATKDENPRIRPVSSKEIIKQVIKNLRRKSSRIEADKKHWKEQIAQTKSDGDLISMSKLIRDLSAQQVVRKLNQSEDTALNTFKTRLLREWAAITKKDVRRIEPEFNNYIQESKNKIIIDK